MIIMIVDAPMSLSHHLFPIPTFQTAFTTCCFNLGPRSDQGTACPTLNLPGVDSVALQDADLGVHYATPGTSHALVIPPPVSPWRQPPSDMVPMSDFSASEDWPAPSLTWEAFYPNGSINPAGLIPGGFGFYVSGPQAFAAQLASGATHAVLSYRMMLQPGWEWVKGGKLPGICALRSAHRSPLYINCAVGGEGDSSYACTGGRQEARSKCFNVRPMWRCSTLMSRFYPLLIQVCRPKGMGELYTYLPLTDRNWEQLSAVPPYSTGNAKYGVSVGRGAFNFDLAVGRWITLAFRVKLNDVGSENGTYRRRF